MEKILQHVRFAVTPSEGVNPISKHVVTHPVLKVQDGLSSSAWKLLKAYVRLAGARDRFNDRVARPGVAQLMQELGWSRERVKRAKRELLAKRAIEVIEREDSASHTPQLVKIYSSKHILATWRQNKWTRVVLNRGKRFANKLGELIEALP